MDLVLPGDVLVPATTWASALLVLGTVTFALWVTNSRCRRAEDAAARVRGDLEHERRRADALARDLKAERERAEPMSDQDRLRLEESARLLRELAGAGDRREMAASAQRALRRMLSPRQVMVFLAADRDGNEFVLAEGGSDDDEAWPQGARISRQMGWLGLVARRRAALDVRDFEVQPPVVRAQCEGSEPSGFRVDIAAPAVVNDRVVALFSVGGTSVPLESARPTVELVAECVAAAVRTAETRNLASRLENTDEASGLANKHHFLAQAGEILYRNRDTGALAALIHFGIDDFRGYVERNGPLSGDRLVRGLTRLIRPMFREGDVLARWSEDEFVALLPGVDHETAFSIMDRLRQSVVQHRWEGDEHQPAGHLTLCAGVAGCPAHGTSLDELLEVAMQTHGSARRSGGDQVATVDIDEEEIRAAMAALEAAGTTPDEPAGA